MFHFLLNPSHEIVDLIFFEEQKRINKKYKFNA